MKSLASLVKEKRKITALTQEEFADRAGVALTVIRKIEQGKNTLNLSSVNDVLLMFGSIVALVNKKDIEVNTLLEKC